VQVQYAEPLQVMPAETVVYSEVPVTLVGEAPATMVVPQVVEQQVVVEPDVVQAVEPGQEAPPAARAVIVCTGSDKCGNCDIGKATGAWCEEICGPYYVFRDAGCEVYFASMNGGQVPIDKDSLEGDFVTDNVRRFDEEGGFALLENVFGISKGEVPADQIDCIFLAGGHGTYSDFGELAQFVTEVNMQGKPIGAVCHGVIGLVNAVTPENQPLLAGRSCTGFSDTEEAQVGLIDKVPYSVQRIMEEAGAVYSAADPWSDYAIRHDNIITGQNPQSSVQTATLTLEALSEMLSGAPAQ
jgi:putative intracellular protease/amidase